jgi:signal transduction histidine kinase
LKLPPNYGRLEIDFTSLSFVGIENIRFRYRLAGLEKDWTEVPSDERAAKYSRMPAGDYRFEVTACNSEGVWNETGPVLAITVLPYFWQTWWFITSAGVLLLGLAVTGARYIENKRVKRQLAQLERERMIERERARIAKDIHDDLGANLTEITLLSELAQSSDAPAQEVQSDVRRIATKARDLTHSLDEIVWAVNPRNDTLDSFVTYTCIHAEDYLKTAGIRCRLKVPGKVESRALATDVRHNLFLVVKEALNNIIKHANATEVLISFSLERSRFEIAIKDNGRGFNFTEMSAAAKESKERPAGGNGLLNMRQRMEDIGGSFELQSAPGEGTAIRLVVRWVEH